MSSDPLGALDRAIQHALWARSSRRPCPPGSIVASAPREDRDSLASLLSDQIRSVRQDVVILYMEEDRGREARLRFDKHLSRHGRL